MGLAAQLKKLFKKQSVHGIPVNSYNLVQKAAVSRLHSSSIYLNNIYNRISTDIASMNLKHVKITKEDGTSVTEPQTNSQLQYLLSIKMNSTDNPRAFWTDVSLRLLKDGIVIILPSYKKGAIQSLTLVEEYEVINYETKQKIAIGSSVFDLDDLVIIRDPNHGLHNDLYSISSLLNDAINALSMKIAEGNRGLFGFFKLSTNTSMDEEMLAMTKKRVEDLVNNASSTGIGVLQKDEDFKELNKTIETVDIEHLEFLIKQLKDNYGINDKILDGSYNEAEYKAYLQNVINPYQELIVQALNSALFSRTAITQGHKIINTVNLMSFASIEPLSAAMSKLKYIGAINSNEIREIIGLPSYVGGDRYETNANAVAVEADDKDQYDEDLQVNESGGDSKDE